MTHTQAVPGCGTAPNKAANTWVTRLVVGTAYQVLVLALHDWCPMATLLSKTTE